MGIEPLEGHITVAETGTRFEADAMVARLESLGIPASILGDPAGSVAPHMVSQRYFQVIAPEEHEPLAAEVVADAETEAEHMSATELSPTRGLRNRPRWVQVATWLLVATFIVPLAIGGIGMIVAAFRTI